MFFCPKDFDKSRGSSCLCTIYKSLLAHGLEKPRLLIRLQDVKRSCWKCRKKKQIHMGGAEV